MGALTLYDKMVEQNAMKAIEELGRTFAKCGMFGITSESQGQIMAMTCLVEGITPVEFARKYHIVEGRLSMKADAMLARYQELGGKVIWQKFDDKECRGRWIYNGNDIEVAFTISDAHRARLCGPGGTKKEGQKNDGNWQKYPDAMLRARCTSKAIRMLAPQVNAGVYAPEELDDEPNSIPAAPVRERTKKRWAQPAAQASEPKETEATIVDDPQSPPPQPETPPASIDLSDVEDAANAFLVKAGWLADGKTWRDLPPERVNQIADRPDAFRAKIASLNGDNNV